MKLKFKRRGFCQLLAAGATVAGSVALGDGSVAGFSRSNGTIRSSEMKMQVFVDKDENIVAITPAPVDVPLPADPQATNSENIVFGGSVPEQQIAGMKRYELDLKDLSIDFEKTEVEQLH